MNDGRTLELGASERGFIYAVGRRYVREDDAADEVAQEAMLTAYRSRELFRGESHPRTWLYRIATNAAFDYLRRRARRRAREDAFAACAPVLDQPATRPDEALSAREQVALISDKLDELDAKYADVLRMRAQELADREIADELGLSLGAVKVRAHRARAMLRGALGAG